MCGNENHEKGTKHIHASAADLLHIRTGNLNRCKCRHCKNEVREIKTDCLMGSQFSVPVLLNLHSESAGE